MAEITPGDTVAVFGCGPVGQFAIASALLVGSIFIAARFGLVDLIARGYRALAWLFLVVYVLPLLTIGAWRLRRHSISRRVAASHH